MTIRQALSAISVTQWADVKPLLRVRIIDHRAAGPPCHSPILQNLGQGVALRATIVLDCSDGEATIPIRPHLIASWNVDAETVWESAAFNTRCAAAISQAAPSARATYQGWRLTFLGGHDHLSASAIRLYDRPRHAGETRRTMWWSVLSRQAIVLLRPPDRQAAPIDKADAWLVVAGLTSVTDQPLSPNLFTGAESESLRYESETPDERSL